MAETKEKAKKPAAKASKPAAKSNNKSAKSIIKVPEKGAFYGTGRRKSSVARVWMFPGKGNVIVNNADVKDYICRDTLVDIIMSPLRSLKLDGKYDVKIFTKGGGLTGQAGAAQMGLARAILSADENFRKSLREHGFLSRDTRIKERKKYGKRGARKGPQYRKR